MGFRNSKILLVVLSLGVTAFFIVSAQSTTEKDRSLGKVFDRYATIAGGWWLESRCNTLAENLKHEFEWHVAQINVSVAKRSNPMFLMTLQSSARNTVEAEYTECDRKSRDFVVDALVMARTLNRKLSGQPYVPGVSYALYTIKRFYAVAIGIEVVMKACDHLNSNPRLRSHVTRIFDSVSNHLKSKYPGPMENISVELESKKSNFQNAKCDENTQKLVIASLTNLLSLEKELGLKTDQVSPG